MGSNGSKFSRPAADDAEGSRPLRKSPHSFLVPLFSSLSCGTSSSWRKDSFMQERFITHGDHVARQTSLETPVAYGHPSVLPLQSLGGTFRRDISDDHSVTDISSASVQSLCGSVESTDTTVFNGCSSNVGDDANSSLLGRRRMSDRQAANMSCSQISLDTQSSNHECLSIYYDSHEEYSSNQTILGACNVGNVSRVDDTSNLTFKQESSANRTDLGWPQALSCDGSSMAMDPSSSHDTVNADQSENHGVPQYDVAGLVEAVDDFSISRPESSGREARRNNGRRLWDALTRAASRRRIFSSAHTQPDEDANSSRNVNDDWGLLDWNSHELTNISAHESGSVSRSATMEERRWRTRPQSWALQHSTDSVRGRFGHLRHCALNRHANGNCSCEAFAMTDESSTRASISRIVMLAEALFEVLDEIHRQSVTLSRSTSLSLVSMPAPEEVVNSLASRIHRKSDPSVSSPGQCAECYICLIEYEEGDYIRVLPCSHVFHMLCVDRWLKEAHRVCPLCRRNVCEESMRS